MGSVERRTDVQKISKDLILTDYLGTGYIVICWRELISELLISSHYVEIKLSEEKLLTLFFVLQSQTRKRRKTTLER